MTSSPEAPSPQRSAAWRRWRAGLIGLPLLLLALLLVGEATGWPFLRGPLERGLQRVAGVSIKIGGEFRARLFWQPGLSAAQLVVGPADGMMAPHLLAAEGVSLRWHWGDLWRFRQGEPLRIRSLDAQHIDARLLRSADGRATWHLGVVDGASGAPAAERPAPVIERLQVATGKLQVDDAPLQLQLAVSVQSTKPARGAAQPGLELTAQGRYRSGPVTVRAQTAAALPLLASLDDAATLTGLSVDARVARAHLVFNGEAAALLSASRLKGALQLSGPSLAAVGQPLGLVLPETPAFKLQGRIAHTGSVWGLVAEHATIGSSALAGAFSYDTATAPARLSGRLTGSRLALQDLGPAIGADKPPARPGRVLPDEPLNLPSLARMDANVLVDIAMLDLGTRALAPLGQVHTHLRLQQGALQLDDLSASVAGGRVSGSSRLDTRSGLPQWTAALNFAGLDVAGWVRGLRTPAGVDNGSAKAGAALVPAPATLKRERQAALQAPQAPAQAYLTGLLDAELKLSGQGRSVAEILATLQGDTRLVVRDGTFSHLLTEAMGLDLAQALGVALRGDRSLPLRCARLDASVRQGVLVPRFAVLDNADSTLRLSGQVNLRDETLALRIVASPRDFSPLSLRSPVTIGGTLGAPAVGIDPRRLGTRALAALALAAVAPAAALIPFIEAGKDPSADPCLPDAKPPATPARQKAPTG